MGDDFKKDKEIRLRDVSGVGRCQDDFGDGADWAYEWCSENLALAIEESTRKGMERLQEEIEQLYAESEDLSSRLHAALGYRKKLEIENKRLTKENKRLKDEGMNTLGAVKLQRDTAETKLDELRKEADALVEVLEKCPVAWGDVRETLARYKKFKGGE